MQSLVTNPLLKSSHQSKKKRWAAIWLELIWTAWSSRHTFGEIFSVFSVQLQRPESCIFGVQC